MTGRRLSVRLRALLITLIFTKSLRRTGLNSKTSQVTDSRDGAGLLTTDRKLATKEGPEVASMGKITNLLSNDVTSFTEIGSHLQSVTPISCPIVRVTYTSVLFSFLWPEAPIQIILAGTYLYLLLGYSALAGMFCIVIAVPIQSYLTSLWASEFIL
jgi:hypothetical protein